MSDHNNDVNGRPKVISSIVVIRGGVTDESVKFFMENPTGDFKNFSFFLSHEVIGEFPNNRNIPFTCHAADQSPNVNTPNLYHVSGTFPQSNLPPNTFEIFEYKAQLKVDEVIEQSDIQIFFWNS